MSRLVGHPDPAALASLRAGQVGTRRGRRLTAHVARCGHCAAVCKRLDVLGAMLASVPEPPLPRAAERRIVTALALESVSRVWQDGPGIPRPRSAMWRPEPGIAQARPVAPSQGRARGAGRQRDVGRQQADRPRGVVPARRWPPRPRLISRAFTGPWVLFPAVASLIVV